MTETHYIIRGGEAGRERLRLLSRILGVRSTGALLDEVGVRDGARCLDAGCGGGDVTRSSSPDESGRKAPSSGSTSTTRSWRSPARRRSPRGSPTSRTSSRRSSPSTIATTSSTLPTPGFCSRTSPTLLWCCAAGPVDAARAGWSLEDVDFAGCFCHPRLTPTPPTAISMYAPVVPRALIPRSADGCRSSLSTWSSPTCV